MAKINYSVIQPVAGEVFLECECGNRFRVAECVLRDGEDIECPSCGATSYVPERKHYD